MAEPLRVCVVGCGRFSKSHLAGMPEDVAKAALYLTPEDSAFATGSIFVVDGG